MDSRSKGILLNAFALIAVALAAALVVFGNLNSDTSNQILNVSYDATRELYKDVNAQFVAKYQRDTGRTFLIKQSNGESANQSQAVIAGLRADVVSLAMDSDIDALSAHHLLASNWENRLPHHSHPYTSTIVFVVRQGNPKRIADWSDLIQPGVTVVTSVPRTSGNGKLSLLGAWGSVVYRGGTAEQARQFVRKLRGHLLALDAGSRGVSKTFSEQKLGDVHLAWENEALLETDNSRGALQIVYPPVSIQAEPSVAWVDADVANTPKAAFTKAYLQFLYTDQGQEIIAQHDLRPINTAILKKHSARLPELNQFPVSLVAENWKDILDTTP